MPKSERDCGECIACCVYQKIPALDKPALTHCEHLKLSQPIKKDELQYSSGCDNCSTYNDRPQVCKAYACMWLLGYGDEDDRPDKSLMLIDTTYRIENTVECKPLSEFAADSIKGKKAIINISRDSGAVALVTSFYETKLVRVIGRSV